MTETNEKRGFIYLRGVVVLGVTLGELETIQDVLGGEGIIEANPLTGEAIIRQAGISKSEIAGLVEGVLDITIEGSDGEVGVKPKEEKQRHPFDRHIKTRSTHGSKIYG